MKDEILPLLKSPDFTTSHHVDMQLPSRNLGTRTPGTKEHFRGNCFLLTHNYIMQN